MAKKVLTQMRWFGNCDAEGRVWHLVDQSGKAQCGKQMPHHCWEEKGPIGPWKQAMSRCPECFKVQT